MTISTTTSRVRYSGNDSTTVFAYTFKINAASHLDVTIADANDSQTALVLNTDYTVSGVGEASGGNVTYTGGGTPLPTGSTITIMRVVPLTQSTDLENQGSFYAETHESAFDYLTMVSQQQQEELDRCLQVSKTSGLTGSYYLTQVTASQAAAAASASAASTSETNASTSASAASTSASAASNSASAASTSETNASNSASAASTSETNAAASEAAAAASAAGLNAEEVNGLVMNAGFAVSVDSGAATIALKQSDGSSDPSTGDDAVKVRFNDGDGSSTLRSVTSALSLVIPSGATLNHLDATEGEVYIYLVDSDGSGTMKLAVSSVKYPTVETVTTVSIDDTADSVSLYSDAAYSSKRAILIGRWKSTQTTAGTWAATTGEKTVDSKELYCWQPVCCRYTTDTARTLTNNAFTTVVYEDLDYDHYSAYNTSTGVFTAPIAGKYQVTFAVDLASASWAAGEKIIPRVSVNSESTTVQGPRFIVQAAITSAFAAGMTTTVNLSTGDTVEATVYQNQGADQALSGANNYLCIERVG